MYNTSFNVTADKPTCLALPYATLNAHSTTCQQRNTQKQEYMRIDGSEQKHKTVEICGEPLCFNAEGRATPSGGISVDSYIQSKAGLEPPA